MLLSIGLLLWVNLWSTHVQCSVQNHFSTLMPPAPPDINSNRIFYQLQGLLKGFWGTYAPVGHGLVPAHIRPGTLLFHARAVGSLAKGLDWFALSPDHSYAFSSVVFAKRGLNSTMYTYMTKRTIRALYFDGLSAAKTGLGPLDAQHMLMYGAVQDKNDDWDLGRRLCEWADELEIDGIVRSIGSPEFIACHFESDAYEMTAATNISAQFSEPEAHFEGLPLEMPDDPYAKTLMFNAMRSASSSFTHSDPRIEILPEHFVTLYDEVHYPSLGESNRAPTRDQRLGNLSAIDLRTWRREIASAIDDWKAGRSSGIDWISIAQTVHDRYHLRLSELRSILYGGFNLSETASRARLALFQMINPWLESDLVISTWPGVPSHSTRRLALAETASKCSSAYTAHFGSIVMTPQEVRLKRAIEVVHARICGYLAGLMLSVSDVCDSDGDVRRSETIVATWQGDLDDLMSWLAWADWHQCPKICAANVGHVCSKQCPALMTITGDLCAFNVAGMGGTFAEGSKGCLASAAGSDVCKCVTGYFLPMTAIAYALFPS